MPVLLVKQPQIIHVKQTCYRAWYLLRTTTYLYSHDMGHDVTIYRDISCDITHTRPPRNTRHKSKFNENPPPRRGLLLFFSAVSLPSSWMCSSGLFLSFSCCPSAGHIIGLTVSHANSNLVPSGLGLLPERMHVFFFFHFSFSPFFPCLFSLDTWYLVLLTAVVARYLIYYCC